MREKQRAKDEVNRLNGVVSGSSGAGAAAAATGGGGQGQEPHDAPWRRRPIFHPPAANHTRQQATPAERRRQLAQLAEMGIAVPEEFRGDLAMAGDWQVVSERAIFDNESVFKDEEDEAKGERNEERKYAEGLSIGVRKRKYEGQEEEEEEVNETGEMMEVRKGWGSSFHTYPNPRGEEDLDSLLGKTKMRRKDDIKRSESGSPPPPPVDAAQQTTDTVREQISSIKQVDADEIKPLLPPTGSSLSNNNLKEDPDGPEQPGIVFKKRKAKPIRNR